MALLYAEKMAKYLSAADFGTDNDSNNSGTSWVANGIAGSQLDLINSKGRWGERVYWLDHNNARNINIPWVAVTANDTVIIGCAVYFDGYSKDNTATNGSMISTDVFMSATAAATASGAGAAHWALGISAGGTISVFGQGTENSGFNILTRIDGYIRPRTWHWLEVKCKMANAATGTFELKIDGVSVYTNVVADFLNNVSTTLGFIRFRANPNFLNIDEVVICDATGSAPFNNFFGDIRLECHVPDADGALTQWTANGAGSNFQCIDDALAAYNDDTDYISETTDTEANLASHAPFSLTGATTIHFTKLDALARTDGTDDIRVRVVSDGNTDASPGDITLNAAYRWRYRFFELDPDGSVPWTLSQINAAEWGVSRHT